MKVDAWVNRQMRVKHRGFSLVEILIAVVVLAIALSGLASALFFGVISGQYADERSIALAYARQFVEIIKVNSGEAGGIGIFNFSAPLNTELTQADGARSIMSSAPFNGTMLGSAGQFASEDAKRYRRNIRVTRYGPNLPFAGLGFQPSLAEIRVRLYWWNHGVERMLEVTAHDSRTLSTI